MIIVTKKLLTGPSKLSALPKYFGPCFMQFEARVFNLMRHYCPDYSGGDWNYYNLSNGGFFMSVKKDARLQIIQPDNHFEEMMSPEAASVGINLYAINQLQWSEDLSEGLKVKLQGLYEKLEVYAGQRDESGIIFRFLD